MKAYNATVLAEELAISLSMVDVYSKAIQHLKRLASDAKDLFADEKLDFEQFYVGAFDATAMQAGVHSEQVGEVKAAWQSIASIHALVDAFSTSFADEKKYAYLKLAAFQTDLNYEVTNMRMRSCGVKFVKCI